MNLYKNITNSKSIIPISFIWYFSFSCIIQAFFFYFVKDQSLYENSFGLVLPDSLGFHQDASILASLMNQYGFGIWELKPDKCGTACYDEMVALTSLVYYFIFPHPISMILINAILQSITVYIIYLILNKIFNNKKYIFYSCLFFLLLPSQFLFIAQIQRDGLFSLAIVLYLYLVLNFFYQLKNNKTNHLLEYFKIIFFGFIILLILNVTRHYYIQILNLFVFIILIIQIFYYLINYRKNFSILIFLKPILIACTITYFSFFFNFSYMKQHSYLYFIFQKVFDQNLYMLEDLPDAEYVKLKKEIIKINNQNSNIKEINNEYEELDSDEISNKNNDNKIIDSKELLKEEKTKITAYEYYNQTFDKNFVEIRNTSWNKTSWIPQIIDNKIMGLAFARLGFLSQSGRTSVDNDVQFKSSLDVILYFPRAIQIGLYSPFPNLIFKEDITNFNKFLLLVTFIESIFAFFITILFFLNFKKIFFKIENFILINFCLFNIVIFCLTVNNIGTVLRMRYIFFALFLCIILVNIFDYLKLKLKFK